MRSKLYAVAGACLTVAAFTLPGLANASPAAAATGPTASAPSPALAPAPALATSRLQGDCPPPASLSQEQCQSAVIPHGAKTKAARVRAAATTSVLSAPLTASDLQSAYGITSAASSDGAGQTVAVVDAYADPTIAGDLDSYRSNNNLPACDSGCFTVYNQNGTVIDPATATSTTKPSTPPDTSSDDEIGWENETALDVEMISAICPNCHIDLFEANSSSMSDLGPAENSAAKDANFVSNSWAGLDYAGESAAYNAYFNHPGKAIVFASGDYGYGATYPASSQFVTSVGGTYLDEPTGGTWTQSVWANQAVTYAGSTYQPGLATASGCSSGEPQPSWGPDSSDSTASSLCANRTQNDVSAVAASPYGVGIYSNSIDSVDPNNSCEGATPSCPMLGTSVATPIITAMYALAGTPTANTYPASYLYQSATGLTRVTSGNDSLLPYTCERSRGYLCSAAASLTSPYNGYNGPAGLGTPNGNLNPFKNTATANVVSVANPGTQDLQTGRSFSLKVNGLDSDSSQSLTYTSSGLPSGLSLNSSSGVISGSVAAAGTSTVKVTATDPTGASTSVSFQITVVGSMTASYHASAGAVKLSYNGKCLDDNGDSSANGAKIQIWQCYSGDKGQTWTYEPDTYPGDPANGGASAGTVRINGKCLDIVNAGTANGAKVQLWSCGSQSPNQQWEITGSYGELYNPASNKCLEDPGWSNSNGTQLDIWACTAGANQNWALPASPIDSAISNRCLNDSGGSSANGTHILSYGCDGSAPEKWTVAPDGTIRIYGKCLDDTAEGVVNGTYAQLYSCNGQPNQQWYIGAYGQIESVNAEKCLAIPGNSTGNGARVALEDCYGQPGELWAVS